jgi:hypothetical protein
MKELFQAIDDKNGDRFVTFLTENARFKFGNADAVEGRAAILQAVVAFFASIQKVEHQLLESCRERELVFCRGTVTYTRHDGTRLAVPFANFFKMSGDLISQYQIYVDTSELYART